MKALIDGDNIIFRAAMAIEKQQWQFTHDNGKIDTFPGMHKRDVIKHLKEQNQKGALQKTWLIEGTAEDAVHNARSLLFKIGKALEVEPGNSIVCLALPDMPSYRKTLAKLIPYKEGRVGKHRPVFEREVREYVLQEWKSRTPMNGQEADDIMGTLQTDDSVICTVDKDLDMIPGKHYNYVTDEKYETHDGQELYLEEHTTPSGKKSKKLKGGGIKWFYAQMLLGDSADDIPHMDKYGPVKVCNLLKDAKTEEEMLKVVQDAYKRDGHTIKGWVTDGEYEYLSELADLLWIQRVPGERKSETLWEH